MCNENKNNDFNNLSPPCHPGTILESITTFLDLDRDRILAVYGRVKESCNSSTIS